jgi:hypothetical protein
LPKKIKIEALVVAKWSSFQTPLEIQTKKSGFHMVGPFENMSSFQMVKLV